MPISRTRSFCCIFLFFFGKCALFAVGTPSLRITGYYIISRLLGINLNASTAGTLSRGQNGAQKLEEPPSTHTTPTMSPSLSSSGAIARAAISPPSADRSMTSTQVVLISFGVFVASGIFLCVWRRIFNMRTFRFLYALVRPNPQDSQQEGKNAGDPENGHPKMSDTWIERCITGSLRWEEYMVGDASCVSQGWRLRCRTSLFPHASSPAQKQKTHPTLFGKLENVEETVRWRREGER